MEASPTASVIASSNSPAISSSNLPNEQSYYTRRRLSDPIPLPKSHVHRTPSEMELSENTLRAEYETERMHSRLVNSTTRGMAASARSLHCDDVLLLKTNRKADKDDDSQETLKNKLDEYLTKKLDDYGDWELSYTPPKDYWDRNSVDERTPLNMKSQGNLLLLLDEGVEEGDEVENMMAIDVQEDSCVFSLEL